MINDPLSMYYGVPEYLFEGMYEHEEEDNHDYEEEEYNKASNRES